MSSSLKKYVSNRETMVFPFQSYTPHKNITNFNCNQTDQQKYKIIQQDPLGMGIKKQQFIDLDQAFQKHETQKQKRGQQEQEAESVKNKYRKQEQKTEQVKSGYQKQRQEYEKKKETNSQHQKQEQKAEQVKNKYQKQEQKAEQVKNKYQKQEQKAEQIKNKYQKQEQKAEQVKSEKQEQRYEYEKKEETSSQDQKEQKAEQVKNKYQKQEQKAVEVKIQDKNSFQDLQKEYFQQKDNDQLSESSKMSFGTTEFDNISLIKENQKSFQSWDGSLGNISVKKISSPQSQVSFLSYQSSQNDNSTINQKSVTNFIKDFKKNRQNKGQKK